MAFNFSPVNGLLDTNTFPTNPGSEAEARQQFMEPLNQLKNFLNNHKLDEWSKSFGTTGYQRLPSGLILQWGVTEISLTDGAGHLEVVFPLAFPNSALTAQATMTNMPEQWTEGNVSIGQLNPSNAGIRILNSPYSAIKIFWLVIGY